MSGRLSPEVEKLVPETAIALIVTGPFPVEVSVSDSVDFVLTFTLPNVRFVALALNVAVVAFSCSAKA